MVFHGCNNLKTKNKTQQQKTQKNHKTKQTSKTPNNNINNKYRYFLGAYFWSRFWVHGSWTHRYKNDDWILKDTHLSFNVETKSKSIFLVFKQRNRDLFQVFPIFKFRIIIEGKRKLYQTETSLKCLQTQEKEFWIIVFYLSHSTKYR